MKISKRFSGAASLDPALLACCPRSGPPYLVVQAPVYRHPAGADTQKDSVTIRSTKKTISLGLICGYNFMIT